MLLKLSVKNFLSFKEKTGFSMIATAGSKFEDTLQQPPSHSKKILPISGIFGGPNTGNENLGRALRFFKTMVTEAPDFIKTLNLYAFQNYSDERQLPVSMGLELLAGGAIYRYNFVALQDIIINERLIKITSTQRIMLYERRKKKIKLHRLTENFDDLRGLVKSLPKTQLFLPYTISNKIYNYEDVYKWFQETLQISGPDSSIQPKQGADKTHADSKQFYDFVNMMDINSAACRLDSRVAAPDDPVHEAIKNDLTTQCGNFTIFVNQKEKSLEVYYRFRAFNEYKVLKVHPFDNENDLEYYPIVHPFADEREKNALLSVLALTELTANLSPRVYVNTQFDNSFELILAHKKLAKFLDSCNKDSSSQFIITLSSPLLLDKMLFRPDEIWITERGDFGDTLLLSLSDYKKSIKNREVWKGYQGNKIGGIYTTLHMAALEVGRFK
jgi:AAA15 family ATPase/GTPase